MAEEMYKHANIKHRYTDFGQSHTTVARYRIKFRDVFQLKYFYMLLHEWMVENEYASRKDYIFPETFMMHRETQQMGREYWVHWRCEKSPIIATGNPKSKMLWKFNLDVIMHMLHIKDTEIMHQGKKYKANTGEIEIKVRANLVYDFKKQWGKSVVMRHFSKILLKRVMKNTFERQRRQFYSDAYRLQEAMKTYLKLRTYLPEPEHANFWKTRDLE